MTASASERNTYRTTTHRCQALLTFCNFFRYPEDKIKHAEQSEKQNTDFCGAPKDALRVV